MEFQQRLHSIISGGFVSLSIALGIKLDLFKALCEISSETNPVTAKELADRAKLKERYVKEWLGSMACANIIEVTKDEKFYIKDGNKKVLFGENIDVLLTFSRMLPMFGGDVFGKISEVFRIDGPQGMDYSSYTDFHRLMDEVSQDLHKKHLIPDFLPLINIQDKLNEGISCLDIGCGNGFHVSHLGKHFPNSLFTGVDINLNAVLAANDSREKDPQTGGNIRFLQMDAKELKKSWDKKFDWVTIFDACHDQQRPDLCLKEVYRVLKDDGVFTMIEINGTGSIYKDKKELNEQGTVFYTTSLFHCLPVGSNSQGALELGAMWGREKAESLLNEAGFKDIKTFFPKFFAANIIYVCKK